MNIQYFTQLVIFLNIIINVSSICKTADYCPGHWNVLRKPDGTPQTCNAMSGNTKCQKPYSCVHSRCGMDFCCAHTYKLEQYKIQQEIEEDTRSAEKEDLEDEEEL